MNTENFMAAKLCGKILHGVMWSSLLSVPRIKYPMPKYPLSQNNQK